jgi:hypothetical protein
MLLVATMPFYFPGRWAQRSVDLAPFAGETVTLALATESEQPGKVAFWAAPTLSGSGTSERPNIILYVIDCGGADYMSAYGYDRKTTPTRSVTRHSIQNSDGLSRFSGPEGRRRGDEAAAG